MKRAPGLALVLGIWLGATIAVMATVAWSFQGIEHALEANPKLAAKAKGLVEKREKNILHVYAGETNRAIFYGWNRVQLALAAAALIIAVLRVPRAGLIASLMLAGVIVLALTFYAEPELAGLGRTLDFVPKDTPDRAEDFRRFGLLHGAYFILEILKTLLVIAASFAAVRGVGGKEP